MEVRAYPAISHCSHLLLKCRVASNISHWLKVHSRGSKNTYLRKKCIWISIWIFQYCFHYTFTVNRCAIFYFLNTEFFNTIRVSNSLDPDQTRHFIGPDLGPNCLQRLSADNKSCPWRAKSLIQNNLLILLSG